MHSTEPEERYFADGIVVDIVHGLAAPEELFVVSRGWALSYGAAVVDLVAA